MNHSKLEIREANLSADIESIRCLWFDYLTWGNNKMQALHGVHPHHPAETVALDIAQIDKFLPPYGSLKLAFVNDIACGIGCLKAINNDIGEIKRMYVNRTYRNIGAGHGILDALLKDAKTKGYKKVRLDSPKFMEAAHALYRKMGFNEIDVYPEVEIPEDFRQYLIFMEKEI
jgi:GNAT superfamily N-acetyltransferase